MISAKNFLAISIGSAALLAACSNSDGAVATEAAPPVADWGSTVADFVDAEGNKTGEIGFTGAPGGGVLMRISLSGLGEGWHGIHLHQIGDCSDGANGFKASGSHINPAGNEAADMPNIHAGADGVGVAEIFNGAISLDSGGPLADADGFAVVVHTNADDHITQPIGGAGARVACAAVHLGG